MSAQSQKSSKKRKKSKGNKGGWIFVGALSIGLVTAAIVLQPHGRSSVKDGIRPPEKTEAVPAPQQSEKATEMQSRGLAPAGETVTAPDSGSTDWPALSSSYPAENREVQARGGLPANPNRDEYGLVGDVSALEGGPTAPGQTARSVSASLRFEIPKGGTYYVIAGSFQSQEAAVSGTAEMKKLGLSVSLLKPTSGSNDPYRITLFQSENLTKAELFSIEVNEAHNLKCWVYNPGTNN